MKIMTLRHTTPVPNVFFDSLMADLSSSGVRVYLKIVRNTFGWRDARGNIKKRDWISHSQFGKVGLSSRSVTNAIDELLSLNLIVLTDELGNILDQAYKRKNAKRIYYSLKSNTQVNSALNNAKNDKNKRQFLPTTKDVSLQKYKANERISDQDRMQQILQNEEEKQIKRDNWY